MVFSLFSLLVITRTNIFVFRGARAQVAVFGQGDEAQPWHTRLEVHITTHNSQLIPIINKTHCRRRVQLYTMIADSEIHERNLHNLH